jgi:peptidyl-prolyl cis-trans isomerase B (cyclophilin B)
VAASKNSEREAREARDRLRRYNARRAVHTTQTTRRRRDNWFAIGALVIVAALATVTQVFYFNGGPGTPTASPSAGPSAAPQAGTNIGNVPDPSLAQGKTWTGTLTLNSVPLAISLDGAAAPQAVSVFLQSVTSNYYVGKTCHRLVTAATARLLQCGSLDGTGATDPSFGFGPIENPGTGGLYPAGTIAMARASGKPYSQGRQFFIVFANSTLPNDSAGGYTIIGQVTSSLADLEGQITNAGVAGGSTDGAPLIPTSITALTIN